jgi:predicted  nucleic acid-binding Zn-ribbon protein
MPGYDTWEWTCTECGELFEAGIDEVRVRCPRCGTIYDTDFDGDMGPNGYRDCSRLIKIGKERNA